MQYCARFIAVSPDLRVWVILDVVGRMARVAVRAHKISGFFCPGHSDNRENPKTKTLVENIIGKPPRECGSVIQNYEDDGSAH